MQKLGQHFLKNKSVIRLIVLELELAPGDTVIEIGPGHGELTLELPITDYGLRIFAIEKDEKLAEALESKIQTSLQGGVKKDIVIVRGDALELLPKLVNDPQSAIRDYKIVGNIPYYITGHLLRIISELENKPERAIFMIQKEVAERIVALSPKMNRLAASVRYWAEPKIIGNLSPEDFGPQPKVDSAIILLGKKTAPAYPDVDRYFSAVRTIFAQPRKTILNNLSQHGTRGKEQETGGRELGKDKLAASLQTLGIDPLWRPQDLSVEHIAMIADILF